MGYYMTPHEDSSLIPLISFILKILEPALISMKSDSSKPIKPISVMFSPVEPTLLSVSYDSEGTELYDIRSPNQ